MTRSRDGKKAMQKVTTVGITTLDSHWPEVVIKPKGKFHRAYAHELLHFDRNVSRVQFTECRQTGIFDIKVYRKDSKNSLHNLLGPAEVNVFIRDGKVVNFHPPKYALFNVEFSKEEIEQTKFIRPEERYIYETMGMRLHNGYYIPQETYAKVITQGYDPARAIVSTYSGGAGQNLWRIP